MIRLFLDGVHTACDTHFVSLPAFDMSTAASSRSSTASNLSDEYSGFPDYVRMMVLKEDTGAVLMTREDGEWHLPYFIYPKSLSHRVDRCYGDLQRFLGIESDDICFTVDVELMGLHGSTGKREDEEVGYARLMKVDCHIDAFALPTSAAWKDADFLSSLLKDESSNTRWDTVKSTLELTLSCMQPENSIFASLYDPRYQRGWFRKAAEFLVSVVRSAGEVSGRVIQEHVSPTSTMLSV